MVTAMKKTAVRCGELRIIEIELAFNLTAQGRFPTSRFVF